MTPVSPVIKGLEEHEIVLAKDQPQYMPMPVLVSRDKTRNRVSRWTFTAEERAAIAVGCDILVQQWTFDHAYPPVQLMVVPEDAVLEAPENYFRSDPRQKVIEGVPGEYPDVYRTETGRLVAGKTPCSSVLNPDRGGRYQCQLEAGHAGCHQGGHRTWE